jgi:hypothetical protein
MEGMNNHNPSFLDWRSLARTHPSAFLLAAQLLSLFLYAAFDGNSSGRVILGAFGILILTLVVWVVTRSPALNWIAGVLVPDVVTRQFRRPDRPGTAADLRRASLLKFYQSNSNRTRRYPAGRSTGARTGDA